MKPLNLKQYYPYSTEDTIVEVSDEIVEAFLLDKRAEAARERKMYRYKAFYSLDCNDGIEKAAIGWAQPAPEDCLMEKKVKVIAAMDGSTPSQAGKSIHAALRRLRRYFMRRKWTSGL